MAKYEHKQLDKILKIFYTEKCTGDRFESLKSMLAALIRYLKEHDYKYYIIQSQEFHQFKLPPRSQGRETLIWAGHVSSRF